MGLMSCSIHSFTKEFDNLLTIAKIKRYSLLPYIEYTVRFFFIYYSISYTLYTLLYLILVRCTLHLGKRAWLVGSLELRVTVHFILNILRFEVILKHNTNSEVVEQHIMMFIVKMLQQLAMLTNKL